MYVYMYVCIICMYMYVCGLTTYVHMYMNGCYAYSNFLLTRTKKGYYKLVINNNTMMEITIFT